MSDHSKFFTFLYEAPGDNPGGGEVTPPAEGEVVEQEVWTPSQDEFSALQEQVKQLTGIAPSIQQMQQTIQKMQQPDVEEDEGEVDLGEYIQAEIQRAIAPMVPIVSSAAQKSGQERMAQLFKEQEAKLKMKFDHSLAERVATHFYNETGDPVKAVEEGAKFAAEYRKQEREAAVKEYQDSLKGGHGADPAVEGGGSRSAPPAKSYDEVIARWAPETEV